MKPVPRAHYHSRERPAEEGEACTSLQLEREWPAAVENGREVGRKKQVEFGPGWGSQTNKGYLR